MTEIRFARERSFPLAIVSQRVAIMGTSGGGKSYGASVFVEGLLDAGAQVVIVDPLGIWWGLRFDKGGKKPSGIKIPVLGGDHGDIPLEHRSGELIARLVAQRKASCVLDVSDFSEGEKRVFVEAFARTLLHEKKRNPGPVLVVWEECDDFVPQNVQAREAPMVGAMQKLVKKGRNYGCGNVLISQRPQAVSKTALNQCGLLLAFQTIGSHERKAIKDWVVHAGAEQHAALAALPALEVGTCFAWSPAWLRIFDKVHVLEKRTLDTGRPPEGSDIAPTALPPIDMDELSKMMAATIEKAKGEDPKLLQAKIALLEKDLASLRAREPETKVVEVPALTDAQEKALRVAVDSMGNAAQALLKATTPIAAALDRMNDIREGDTPTAAARARQATQAARVAQQKRAPTAPAPRLGQSRGAARESRPAPLSPTSSTTDRREWIHERHTYDRAVLYADSYTQALLEALAKLESLTRKDGWSDRRRMAAVAGKSPSSSTFEAKVAALRKDGLIEYGQGGTLRLTDAGKKLAPVADAPPSPAELRASYALIMPAYQVKLLEALVDDQGAPRTREDLAEMAGVSAASSTFEAALANMRALGVVEYGPGGMVMLNEDLV